MMQIHTTTSSRRAIATSQCQNLAVVPQVTHISMHLTHRHAPRAVPHTGIGVSLIRGPCEERLKKDDIFTEAGDK